MILRSKLILVFFSVASILIASIYFSSCSESSFQEETKDTKSAFKLIAHPGFQTIADLFAEMNHRIEENIHSLSAEQIEWADDTINNWTERELLEADVEVMKMVTDMSEQELREINKELEQAFSAIQKDLPYFISDEEGVKVFMEALRTEVNGIGLRTDCCGCDRGCNEICWDYEDCWEAAGVNFLAIWGSTTTIMGGGGAAVGFGLAGPPGAAAGGLAGGTLGLAGGLIGGGIYWGWKGARCERRKEAACRTCPCL